MQYVQQRFPDVAFARNNTGALAAKAYDEADALLMGLYTAGVHAEARILADASSFAAFLCHTCSVHSGVGGAGVSSGGASSGPSTHDVGAAGGGGGAGGGGLGGGLGGGDDVDDAVVGVAAVQRRPARGRRVTAGLASTSSTVSSSSSAVATAVSSLVPSPAACVGITAQDVVSWFPRSKERFTAAAVHDEVNAPGGLCAQGVIAGQDARSVAAIASAANHYRDLVREELQACFASPGPVPTAME